MNLKLKICVFVYVIFMATIPVLGLTAEKDEEALILEDIRIIDVKADKLNALRESLRKEMNDSVFFSKEAVRWIKKASKVQGQIRNIQDAPGNTYQGQNKQSLLNKLNTQLNQLNSLNGGVTIVGAHFTSLRQLIEAFHKQSNNAIEMGRQYRDVIKELDGIDRERDAKTLQLKNKAERWIQRDKKELAAIEEERSSVVRMVNDPEIWLLPGFSLKKIKNDQLSIFRELGFTFKGAAPFISREAAMNYITQKYIEKCTAQGTTFDPKVLAAQIASVRDESAETKNQINSVYLPETDRMIAEFRNRISLYEKNLSPTGCWLLVLPGSKDLPQVLIIDQGNGRYEGYIQHVGTLKHFHKNQFLFRAQRQSRSTIGGHERTFNGAGGIVTIPVRITIHEDRATMTYRSDETVTMRRCN